MKILYLILLIVVVSCTTTGEEQSRAYVEGKVLTNLPATNVKLQLESKNIIISETILNSDKTFTLSGPIPGEDFSLKSNFKIKSFTGRSDLKITEDSLSIEFPKGANYENALELKLVK